MLVDNYMKLPPLNALRAFEVAARAGSFVAASDELGVSSAAVSMQVRNLENYLNKKLFIRSNNRITLTDAGQTIYTGSANALNGIAELTGRVLEGEEKTSLVLSVLPSLGERWLAPRLAEFARSEPGLSLEIRVEDDPVDFARHGINMRITFGSHLYSEFRSVTLFHDEVTPLCSPDFLPQLDHGSDYMLISDECFIHVEWGEEFASNPNWNDWFRATGIDRQLNIGKGIKVAAPSFAIALAANGLGIALGQTMLADVELALGTIVAPTPHSLKMARPYCAIIPHAESGNQRFNRLADWLGSITE